MMYQEFNAWQSVLRCCANLYMLKMLLGMFIEIVKSFNLEDPQICHSVKASTAVKRFPLCSR